MELDEGHGEGADLRVGAKTVHDRDDMPGRRLPRDPAAHLPDTAVSDVAGSMPNLCIGSRGINWRAASREMRWNTA
jgi:hypothetical protein